MRTGGFRKVRIGSHWPMGRGACRVSFPPMPCRGGGCVAAGDCNRIIPVVNKVHKPNRSSCAEIFAKGIILVVLLPVIVPLAIISGVLKTLYGLILHIAIWLLWSTRGRRVVYVYSNSPNWQDYIEHQILPKLPENTIVLNWSERRTWRQLSLAVRAHHFYCGDVHHNPAAVVFHPFRLGRAFRFWQPFRDYKHGKPEPLQKAEREMFQYIYKK